MRLWLENHADIAETDGCPDEAAMLRRVAAEIARLESEVERLRGLVKAAEWAGWDPVSEVFICPACEWSRDIGHAPDCRAFHPNGDVR